MKSGQLNLQIARKAAEDGIVQQPSSLLRHPLLRDRHNHQNDHNGLLGSEEY